MRTGAHTTKERGLKWLVFEKSWVSKEFRSWNCWISIVLLVHVEFGPTDFEATSRVKLWTYVSDTTLMMHVLNISEKISLLERGMASMALSCCPMVGEAFVIEVVTLVCVLIVVEWLKFSESMISSWMSSKVLRRWGYTVLASDLVKVMSDVIEHKLLPVHHSRAISLHPCCLWAVMCMLFMMTLSIVHVLLRLLLLLVVDVSIVFYVFSDDLLITFTSLLFRCLIVFIFISWTFTIFIGLY